MIVAHLIGGNEVKGFSIGKVVVNGEELKASYEVLVGICGNIPLDELDTSSHPMRVRDEYARLVHERDDELGLDFVVNNHLTKEVAFSSYEIDTESRSLVLNIETY
jgi:hypothetical protein